MGKLENQIKKNMKKIAEAEAKKAIKVEIIIGPDGRVNVAGFPSNYAMAMEIMTKAAVRVGAHFIGKARAGEVDENYNLVRPRIIQPTSKDLAGIDKRKLN